MAVFAARFARRSQAKELIIFRIEDVDKLESDQLQTINKFSRKL